jgi:hypothetical protein
LACITNSIGLLGNSSAAAEKFIIELNIKVADNDERPNTKDLLIILLKIFNLSSSKLIY